MRAKKIVNQSSDFPVRRTGSYRHKKSTASNLHEVFVYAQCRINHVADVANATGLRPQKEPSEVEKFFSARQ